MSEFNEYLDEEGQEYAYQEFKGSMSKQEQHFQRYQAEKAQQQALANQQKIFNDALKNSGLTQQQFNELVLKNPQEVQRTFEDHVQSYVKTVARKRDPKSGQFLPGKPQAQNFQHGQSVQQRRRTEQSGPTTTELKERVNRGERISDDDVIAALFPDPLY